MGRRPRGLLELRVHVTCLHRLQLPLTPDLAISIDVTVGHTRVHLCFGHRTKLPAVFAKNIPDGRIFRRLTAIIRGRSVGLSGVGRNLNRPRADGTPQNPTRTTPVSQEPLSTFTLHSYLG